MALIHCLVDNKNSEKNSYIETQFNHTQQIRLNRNQEDIPVLK